jgi:hypothetical protein
VDSLDGSHETEQKIFDFAVGHAAHNCHVPLAAPNAVSNAQFNSQVHDWCLRELSPRSTARVGCTQLHEETSRNAFKTQAKASGGAFYNNVETAPCSGK